ncbi:hypothetical protein INR49_020405 [Caranx melampygus]|nr:hypothetical protein INR49_020405 [Caranx melampygus]
MHLCTGVLSVHQLSWLPCQFIDEHVTLSKDGQYDIQLIHREATLQFGQRGDSPVNPQAITFLVTGGSKLDLRRYMDGAEAKQLECEVHRYSTKGIHVRWPVQQPQEYNCWFSCTIKHSDGLFTTTGFLRHPSDQPPPGQQDYRSWPAIADREILTTTVAMVIKTQSPSVTAGLNSQQKLHCQFALDHESPKIMVEWHYRYRTESTKLFRYDSRTGEKEGQGRHERPGSRGHFLRPPTHQDGRRKDVHLFSDERPRVSINIDPTLVMQRGEMQKVICNAENYYPMDVDIIWYEQDPEVSDQSVGAPLPKPFQNVLLSSHKHNNDMTYSVSGFFHLKARHNDSGRQFTCSVSHRSLKTPIQESFLLTVEEPWSLDFKLSMWVVTISLLGVLCYLLLGVLSVHQLSWLPCQFIDEHVTFKIVDNERHYETQRIHREATLQFGQRGDSPVNPQAITFLVTGGSKVDLRRYMDGAEAKQLECEVRRFSTEGIHVRWPVQQPQEYNRWFSCTIKHSKGLFTATGFLRHPSDQPPPGQQDYRSWPAIADREILTTTVAMVIKTQSPSVIARLNSQPKLHCQFALDHRGPNIMVEWHFQHRGERNKLFRYNSRTGEKEGSGVDMKGLAAGDISYVLPLTKIKEEGTYICSVTVDPLFVKPPRVSINVGPTLVLQWGWEHKVICDAENYYPMDVDIVWYEQDPEVSDQSASVPLISHLSSHTHNNDMTYSMSAFFYLQARLSNSGRQFTCSVSHRSLRMPIKNSFILTVEEPRTLAFNLMVWVVTISLVGVLCYLLLAAMVIKTQTPSVKATLSSQQKFHCQFALDHKGPNITVEWHFQHRGERNKLFRHNSRSGKTEGSGVDMKGLAAGDISYVLPHTKMNNEGTYICSVTVDPLFVSLDVNLHVEEPPRVSINVGPTLVLQEGGEHKVVCDADNYYPLDVEIVWYEQDPAVSGQRVGAPLPKPLQNVLLSSHKHNSDKTYSVSAFFYLQAQLRDSGRQFTCSVSHRSLRMPIKKSFILTVEEPSNLAFNLMVCVVMISLVGVLYVLLSYLHSVRKKSLQQH